MLIHLNELLRAPNAQPQDFARVLNETFRAFHTRVLGSLSEVETDAYDLVMTNPPFVMTGTSTFKRFIKEDSALRDYYKINATGIEGLFVEKILRSIKPGGRALVIVPDGLLNRAADRKLRDFILQGFILEAIVSLPENAFYTTSKKTYIVAVRKKEDPADVQTDPVFSYLVVNTGETLDANRFPCENDLLEMTRLFNYFKTDKGTFQIDRPKCKIWPIERFRTAFHWSVDRWWSAEEQRALGLRATTQTLDPETVVAQLQEEQEALAQAIARFQAVSHDVELGPTVAVQLANPKYFDLFIGRRVLTREARSVEHGTIPTYSANPRKPFAWLASSNISSFDYDCVIWGIDGDFDFNVIRQGVPFGTTDHCGCIRIIDRAIDADFLYYTLLAGGSDAAMDRQLRASLQNVGRLIVRLPVRVDETGKPLTEAVPDTHLDVSQQTARRALSKIPLDDPLPAGVRYVLDQEAQQQLVARYKAWDAFKAEIQERTARMLQLQLPPITTWLDDPSSGSDD